MKTLNRLQPVVLSLLRIAAGFTFSLHGLQKLFGMFGGISGKGASVPMFTLLWSAGILETFGGVLILLGLYTRPIAFLLSGQMAVAYFTRHARGAFWPILNGGELAVLYCFLFLYFVCAGPGAWSLDRMIRRVK